MGRGTTLGVYLKAISSSGSLLLLLLLHFHGGEIIAGASAASSAVSGPATEQKCDKVVSVETPELLSYLGNVTFSVPKAFRGRWTATIKFTSPYTFIGGWGVQVQSFGRKAYAIFERTEDENLKAGDKVIFQFRVLYGINVKVPKVMSIKWEKSIICGPPILGEAHTKKKFMEDEDSPSLLSSEEEGFFPDKDESRQYSGNNNDAPNSYGSISGDVSVDDIRDTIQQQIATNNVRLSSWKPAVMKN